MKLAYALHEIVIGPDTKVDPGQVFECKNYDEMIKLGVVREPTRDETSLFNLGRPNVEDLTIKPAAAKPAPVEVKKADPVPSERDLLEERARAAGVDFRSNIGDEKLLERILEAEKARDNGDKDVTESPTSLV